MMIEEKAARNDNMFTSCAQIERHTKKVDIMPNIPCLFLNMIEDVFVLEVLKMASVLRVGLKHCCCCSALMVVLVIRPMHRSHRSFDYRSLLSAALFCMLI